MHHQIHGPLHWLLLYSSPIKSSTSPPPTYAVAHDSPLSHPLRTIQKNQSIVFSKSPIVDCPHVSFCRLLRSDRIAHTGCPALLSSLSTSGKLDPLLMRRCRRHRLATDGQARARRRKSLNYVGNSHLFSRSSNSNGGKGIHP